MKISQFDKKNLAALRVDINEALKAVGAKYGIEISAGNATYAPDTATMKLSLATVSTDGTVADPMVTAFKRDIHYYGLKDTDLGRTFKLQGRTFTIYGLNTKARNRPIVAKSDDGKMYTFVVDDVIRLLAA